MYSVAIQKCRRKINKELDLQSNGQWTLLAYKIDTEASTVILISDEGVL